MENEIDRRRPMVMSAMLLFLLAEATGGAAATSAEAPEVSPLPDTVCTTADKA